jgi:hypothetical protein
LRSRLIKIAARVVEGAIRIRIWLPSACPDAALLPLHARRRNPPTKNRAAICATAGATIIHASCAKKLGGRADLEMRHE